MTEKESARMMSLISTQGTGMLNILSLQMLLAGSFFLRKYVHVSTSICTIRTINFNVYNAWTFSLARYVPYSGNTNTKVLYTSQDS